MYLTLTRTLSSRDAIDLFARSAPRLALLRGVIPHRRGGLEAGEKSRLLGVAYYVTLRTRDSSVNLKTPPAHEQVTHLTS